MKHFGYSPGHGEPLLNEEDAELLRRGIRLNTIILGVVMGLGFGLGLFLFTHLSMLITGDRAGQYLNLLGVIFPGYSATPEGVWFGLIWGFVFGAVSGGFIYFMYARTIGLDLAKTIAINPEADQLLEQPTLQISGHALGLALGSLMALQLFLATSWLIIRGTADQSPNAALLVNYFPGYSVTFTGGLIGAAYMFAVTYVFSLILAGVYNYVVTVRSRKGAQ